MSEEREAPPGAEAERLRALRSYGVLDTEREQAFDDITSLVARLCDAPIAVVNLIDEARQWFKAEVGIGVREMPLDASICAKVFLGMEPVVVPDLTRDARFACLPLVQAEGGLRFYAGAPLVTSEGQALGTLCVIDTRVRGIEPLQLDALVTLAAQVMAQLELRRELAISKRRQQRQLRLSEELKRAEASLREADRRKDDFLATLAHELRNPLAPVLSATQLIARTSGPQPQLRWACDVIERQMRHLVRLVDDLLDVSRISRDKIDLQRERLDLNEALQAAVETSRPLIESQGHALVLQLPSEPIAVVGDGVRLAQVFMNLLTNAAKYTDRGGRIVLAVELRADAVQVRVEDNGIGVAPEQLPHMFEMFYQVESALNRTQGGLGIGLALVKRLVDLHGGSVRAGSAGRGQGSVFEVTLPRAAEAPAAASPRVARAPTIGRRVLIADDNVDAAESLACLLAAMGHEVVAVAHDGQAAVEAAERFEPEVVLLDLGMPRLNGYEAASRIRDLREGGGLLLVALTGWGHDDDVERAGRAGFDAHLVKPADIDALERLMARRGGPRS